MKGFFFFFKVVYSSHSLKENTRLQWVTLRAFHLLICFKQLSSVHWKQISLRATYLNSSICQCRQKWHGPRNMKLLSSLLYFHIWDEQPLQATWNDRAPWNSNWNDDPNITSRFKHRKWNALNTVPIYMGQRDVRCQAMCCSAEERF